MNERIMQFRVGVMVLATAIIAAILVLLFGTSPMGRRSYTIYVRFKDAPGVTKYTPVRKAGIRIGRVSDVQFADQDTAVIVTADIDDDRTLYDDEMCEASSPLLMGDASLNFIHRTSEQSLETSKKRIEPGESIQGYVSRDTNRAIADLQRQMEHTLDTVDTVSKDMHNVLGRVDRLLSTNEDRITKVIGEADETLELLKKTLNSTNDIIGDPQLHQQIRETVAEMPEVIKETRATVAKMGGSITALEDNLHNLEGLTKPLGERGEMLVNRVDTSTEKLDRLMDQMLRFSQELNGSQGTVGQLLHDPELYQHLNHVARNLDELTRDLKPIVADARVFTDKIARHPEELGVRGAIQKYPGIK